MDSLTVVRRLEASHIAVFTMDQLTSMLNLRPGSAAVQLHRLARRGVLVRVTRGRYTLPDTDILAVASGIVTPSYVTLLAALGHHGVTTQTPRVIDVLNSSRSGKMDVELEAGRFVLRFIRVNEKLLYGYDKVVLDGKAAFIADRERVVTDGLLLPEYLPLDETAECIRSGVDPAKAMRYATKTGRQVVVKRLGHLLSMIGMPPDVGEGHISHLSTTYIPLDPSFPRRGRHDPVWRVIHNTVV